MTHTKPAVLFDIDGTLVDSNYMHIAAWSAALVDVGQPVDSWRIHRFIGMDSQKLIAALIGDRAEELGDRVTELHTKHYAAISGDLRVFGQARQLVALAASRGLQAVLATSAPEAELVNLRAVLDIEDDIATVTSSEDVTEAKPAPDIVQVALEKAGVDSARAIMVGDSVWDVQAATAAGVRSIGLLTGGTGRAELIEAGAIAVYDDPADLLAHFDDSALAALAAKG